MHFKCCLQFVSIWTSLEFCCMVEGTEEKMLVTNILYVSDVFKGFYFMVVRPRIWKFWSSMNEMDVFKEEIKD